MSNRRIFGRIKLAIATSGMPCAIGGAQVAEVYQLPHGRNLEANDAHRIVAQVSLGKHSIVFRLGNDAKERKHAIEELTTMLQRARSKGRRIVPLPQNVCECVSTVAVDELAIDMCSACLGAGQVRDHSLEIEGRQPMRICPQCNGALRRRYTDDERIQALAAAWVKVFGEKPLVDPNAVSIVANSLRKHPRVREILQAIDYAKGELITCERVATEEACRMLERWV